MKIRCGNGAELTAEVSGNERKWIAEVNPPYPPSVYFRKHHLKSGLRKQSQKKERKNEKTI